MDDIRWHGTDRTPDRARESQQLAYSVQGASEADCDLYVMINASPTEITFGIHDGAPGDWDRVIDTAMPSPEDFLEPQHEARITSPTYDVGARSIVVLVRH